MRVLSHNAYWFQGHPFKGANPPDTNTDVLHALTALYQSLNPSLLCLQEVQSQTAFSNLTAQLNTPGFYTPGNLLPYGAASFSTSAKLLADSSSAAHPPQRVWQLLQIPWHFTRITIANCHLPSARQLPAPQAALQRVYELQSILQLNPTPDILLGDFNEQLPGPASDLLSSHGYIDAATLFQKTSHVTNIKNRRGDFIWIHQTLAPFITAYNVASENMMRSILPGITHLSDHFPLWIDIEANP